MNDWVGAPCSFVIADREMAFFYQSIEIDWFIKSIVHNVLLDFVLIFIDVFIWYPHQHTEETAAPLMIYTIRVPAVIQLLFVWPKMKKAHYVSFLSQYSLYYKELYPRL